MIALDLSGDARARGRGQAEAAGQAREQVHAATIARVEAARAEGLFDAQAERYLGAQRDWHALHDPKGLAELAGIAEGFGFSQDDLFRHLHLGTLRDMRGGARMIDGCSAFAVADGPDGPLVAKNRDFSGAHLGIQTLARHEGPDVATGAMLCLGSLGAPGAYSSGLNARGLALADTQVGVATHRVGWLRYFLMTRILARCANVAQALELIASAPHAGGGTLVMADAGGAIAAVELGAAGPSVVTAPQVVWRTNHYASEALAGDALFVGGDAIAGNSRARFDHLAKALPEAGSGRERAKRLLSTHPGVEPGAAPILQLGDGDASTISSVVYSCRLLQAEFREGGPEVGWRTTFLSG